MASETEEEKHDSTPPSPKLALFSKGKTGILLSNSPEHPGMATPPLYTTSASVPFNWEEEPGKPRPFTALIPLPPQKKSHDDDDDQVGPTKALHPPPARRLVLITKTPSPNTVLDGPYNNNNNNNNNTILRPKFTSSSFRIFRHFHHHPKSPETEQIFVGLKKKKHKRKGLFPVWGQRVSKNGKKDDSFSAIDALETSYYDDIDDDDDDNDDGDGEKTSVDMATIRRNGSLSSSLSPQAKPHFWATVYEGFKQVMPWKSRKARKGGPLV